MGNILFCSFLFIFVYMKSDQQCNVAERSAINKYDQGGEEEAGNDHDVVGSATSLANTKMIQV